LGIFFLAFSVLLLDDDYKMRFVALYGLGWATFGRWALDELCDPLFLPAEHNVKIAGDARGILCSYTKFCKKSFFLQFTKSHFHSMCKI
jgi:hypothetical protein